jgi:hypothetical protein
MWSCTAWDKPIWHSHGFGHGNSTFAAQRAEACLPDGIESETPEPPPIANFDPSPLNAKMSSYPVKIQAQGKSSAPDNTQFVANISQPLH